MNFLRLPKKAMIGYSPKQNNSKEVQNENPVLGVYTGGSLPDDRFYAIGRQGVYYFSAKA